VIFGVVKNPKMENISDMNPREIIVFASLLIFIVWIGVYPSTFLKVSDRSTARVIIQVNAPPPQVNLK
jgi:NADH-quinone oxidoreductase subunit M